MDESEILSAIRKIPHECHKEGKFAELTTIMTGIVKEFYGNGHKGMAREMPELRAAVENLTTAVAEQNQSIKDLSTTVSGLMRFEAEYTGIEKYKVQEAFSTRQRVAIIMTGR